MKIKVFLVLILIGIFSLSILFSKMGADTTEDKVEAKPNQERVSNVTNGVESVFLPAGSNKVELGFEDNGSEIYEESLEELEEDEVNKEGLNLNDDDRYILAKIAMAEARIEDTVGKALVIRVVLNRAKADEFPYTVRDVVFQKKQFSPVANGSFDKLEPTEDCYKALDMVENGWDESQGALYFESKSSSTWHRDNLKFLFQHGRHFFYTHK